MKKVLLLLLVSFLPLCFMACEGDIPYDSVIEILSFPEEIEEDLDVYSKVTIGEMVFNIEWETDHPEIFTGKSQQFTYEEINEKITLL